MVWSIMLFMSCIELTSCIDMMLNDYESSPVISKDEELTQKTIGPLNQYELINSFPTMYSTDRKRDSDNLLQICDYGM